MGKREKMKKIILIFLFLCPLIAKSETDAEIQLRSTINDVRNYCGGISAQMESLKKMAGIGTVINAVGTGVGVGGVIAGVVKESKDTETLAALKKLEESDANQKALEELRGAYLNSNAKENIKALAKELSADSKKFEKIAENQSKSDKMGNLRTGLFATNTATSVAGAVVSSKTILDDATLEKINLCKESIAKLRDASTRMKVEDGDNVNGDLMQKSQNIIERCGKYETYDMSSLNKLAKGATVSGAVGAVTGTVATITSALGTSKKAVDIDYRDSAQAQKDEKSLVAANKASNVLGGVTAGTSLAGTVLNATQVKKVKQLVTIADNCEGVLE